MDEAALRKEMLDLPKNVGVRKVFFKEKKRRHKLCFPLLFINPEEERKPPVCLSACLSICLSAALISLPNVLHLLLLLFPPQINDLMQRAKLVKIHLQIIYAIRARMPRLWGAEAAQVGGLGGTSNSTVFYMGDNLCVSSVRRTVALSCTKDTWCLYL